MTAVPVCIDREGRELFGWYHPPEAAPRNTVVVFCNPLGYDAMCGHRHYRRLAEQLAAAGFAALRFDYHGTGDSTGSDTSPNRVQAWLNGIMLAMACGQQWSGAAQVSLVGLRMGATLALTAAAANKKVSSLVAWAAFESGRQYVREMRMLASQRATDPALGEMRHDAGADAGEEAAGYLLTHSTLQALEQISPVTTPVPPAARVLLGLRDDIPSGPKLLKQLQSTGCAVEAEVLPGYAGMMRDTYDAVVPEQALARITAWLSACHPPAAMSQPAQAAMPPRLLVESQSGGGMVEEVPLRFGPEQRLFGVLSRPLQQAGGRGRTAVIFISAGSTHRVGPNRMYVKQARALAGLGFVALRFDLGGVGDSRPADGMAENTLYSLRSVDEVRAAVALLRTQQGVENIVLLGLCSGAYQAFHSGLAEPDVNALILINQQVFTWSEGGSLAIKVRASERSMRNFRQATLKRETWGRALRGHINWKVVLPKIASVLQKRLETRVRNGLERLRGNGPAPQLDVLAAFKTLLARNTDVLMIFSSSDGGIAELESHVGANARQLEDQARFNMAFIDGADHTFTPVWSQGELLQVISGYLVRQFG